MSKISGVIFDMDGTLYHKDLLRFFVLCRFLISGVIHPWKTFRELFVVSQYRISLERLRNRLPANVSPDDAQLDMTVWTTGVSKEEISEYIDKWMEDIPLLFLKYCTRKKLIKLIHLWEKMGVPIGIYSDYPSKKKLRALGLETMISKVICSRDSDVMAFKPSPRGFEVAAAKMGLEPSQVVYIGDREDVDGVGAQNAGMMPIILKKSKKNKLLLKPKLTLAILDRQLKRNFTIKNYPSQIR